MNLFITVIIGSGIGAGLANILINRTLESWFKKVFYLFTIKTQKKRELAKRILSLIQIENSGRWEKYSDNIYSESFALADDLYSEGLDNYGVKVTDFTNAHFYTAILTLRKPPEHQINEHMKNITDNNTKVAALQGDLLKIATDLKKTKWKDILLP